MIFILFLFSFFTCQSSILNTIGLAKKIISDREEKKLYNRDRNGFVYVTGEQRFITCLC